MRALQEQEDLLRQSTLSLPPAKTTEKAKRRRKAKKFSKSKKEKKKKDKSKSKAANVTAWDDYSERWLGKRGLQGRIATRSKK